MKLSTRSRYGLRLMLALARNYGKGNTFLKEIAREEGISEKYLSLIIICLLYTSDAADDLLCVDLGGCRIIKKKTTIHAK